jgi:glucokinase
MHYKITITRACFGAAGIITHQRMHVKPTNLAAFLDGDRIKQVTNITDLLFVNDFEATALGIEYINPHAIVTISQGKRWAHGQRACIGAGTGFGKIALRWLKEQKEYIPLASEGGHADCVFFTEEENALKEYLYAEYTKPYPVSWEDVLNGAAIERIYRFLGTRKKYPKTISNEEIEKQRFNPDRISYYAKKYDKHCVDTFKLYAQFYARCAKNFALESLSLNGLYIAGGIAAKNVSIFKDPAFTEEFFNNRVYNELLQSVPLFVITDYAVNLYGAVKCMQLYHRNLL